MSTLTYSSVYHVPVHLFTLCMCYTPPQGGGNKEILGYSQAAKPPASTPNPILVKAVISTQQGIDSFKGYDIMFKNRERSRSMNFRSRVAIYSWHAKKATQDASSPAS